MASNPTLAATRQSAAVPEWSLGLAGTVLKSRYRVNAVSSVSRDVVVYSAEDVQHGRSIALKVLRDEFARDREFVTAVRERARALAVSAHVLRDVQRVYDCGTTETGQLFVALEWVEGAKLRDVLDAGGALAAPTALRIAIRVGEALEALHHNRFVHGQLGPDSVIMVNDGERIRLAGTELSSAYRTPIGLRLRDVFPLSYRAPEQIERGEATAATDVYALGMLLRQVLTAGRAGQTPGAVATTPPLSATIQRIIATALEPRPERRYPDISVMVNDIWGATAIVTEPASRPRSVKPRGNPRRRVRRRRPFAFRVSAAVAVAGVMAASVWVAGLDQIAAQLYSRITPAAVTAVPVERDVLTRPAVMSTAPAPAVPAARESSTVEDKPAVIRPTLAAPSAMDGRPRGVGAPRPPAGVGESRPPAAPRPPVVSRDPIVSRDPSGFRLSTETPPARESAAPVERPNLIERPAALEREAPANDGSAAVDWLLKDRR